MINIICCNQIVVGKCEHNYTCLVCGNGHGCMPDPCDSLLEKSLIIYADIWKELANR